MVIRYGEPPLQNDLETQLTAFTNLFNERIHWLLCDTQTIAKKHSDKNRQAVVFFSVSRLA